MSKKTQFYLLHILGCLLFISIPILSSPDFDTNGHMMFQAAGFRRSFLAYLLLLGFFYVNYFYLIPKFYFSNRRLFFYLLVIIAFIAISMVPNLVFPNLHTMPMNDGNGPSSMPPMPQAGWNGHNRFRPSPLQMVFAPFWGGYLFQFVLVFFISFILRINQRLSHIQNEKLHTEVSYLKAQINPHFLFNTLNSLYALALDKSDAAPEALLKLSSIMRYVVTESSRDNVPLDNEVNYIKNYISLQQLRMDDSTPFIFTIQGNTAGKNIAPMLLIPFIENAFKYGINPEENSAIAINITITDTDVLLVVKNNKVSMHIPPEEKSEKGIENTKMRLEYLYPQKHKLLIFDTPQSFEVQLTLFLV